MDFQMSLEDNIAYAKRNIVDLIYKAAKVEGIGVTFPETYELYEGRVAKGIKVDDVIKVNNLKHAWQFVFDTIDYPCDMRYIKQINQLVQAGLDNFPGLIRTDIVSIGGTKWKPDIPNEEVEKEQIKKLLKIENPTERAINMMTYLMRAQLFHDGNKRTAQLVANQIMIQNGCGIIAIPVEDNIEFFEKLIRFYETNNNKELYDFLFNKCIDGYNHVPIKDICKQPIHITPSNLKTHKCKR